MMHLIQDNDYFMTVKLDGQPYVCPNIRIYLLRFKTFGIKRTNV